MDNKEHINGYIETPEVWQQRLRVIQMIMIEFASAEPDENIINSGTIALLEDIEESKDRLSHYPYNVFRLKTDDAELEIRITTSIKPRKESEESE